MKYKIKYTILGVVYRETTKDYSYLYNLITKWLCLKFENDYIEIKYG